MMDSPRSDDDDEASLDIVCADSEDNILRNNDGDSFGCLSEEDVEVMQPPRGRSIETKSSNLVESLRIIAKSSPSIADSILQNTDVLDRRLSEIGKAESNSSNNYKGVGHRQTLSSANFSGLYYADSRDAEIHRKPSVTVVDYPTNDMVEVFGPLGNSKTGDGDDDDVDDEEQRDQGEDNDVDCVSSGEEAEGPLLPAVRSVRSAISQQQFPTKVPKPASQEKSDKSTRNVQKKSAATLSDAAAPSAKALLYTKLDTIASSVAAARTSSKEESSPRRGVSTRIATESTAAAARAFLQVNTSAESEPDAPSPPISPDVFGPPRRLHADAEVKKISVGKLRESPHLPPPPSNKDFGDENTDDEDTEDEGSLDLGLVGPPRNISYDRGSRTNEKQVVDDLAKEYDNEKEADDDEDDSEDDENENEIDDDSSEEDSPSIDLKKTPSSFEVAPVSVSRSPTPEVSPMAPTRVEPERGSDAVVQDVSPSGDNDDDQDTGKGEKECDIEKESTAKRNLLRRMIRAVKRTKTESRAVDGTGEDAAPATPKSAAALLPNFGRNLTPLNDRRATQSPRVDPAPSVGKSEDMQIDEVVDRDDEEEASKAGQVVAPTARSKMAVMVAVGRSLTPIKARIAARKQRKNQLTKDEDVEPNEQASEAEELSETEPAGTKVAPTRSSFMTTVGRSLTPLKHRIASSNRKLRHDTSAVARPESSAEFDCTSLPESNREPVDELCNGNASDIYEADDQKTQPGPTEDHPAVKKSSRSSRRVISFVGKTLPRRRTKSTKASRAAVDASEAAHDPDSHNDIHDSFSNKEHPDVSASLADSLSGEDALALDASDKQILREAIYLATQSGPANQVSSDNNVPTNRSKHLVNMIGRAISPKKIRGTKNRSKDDAYETSDAVQENLDTSEVYREVGDVVDDAADDAVNGSPPDPPAKQGLFSRVKRALSPPLARPADPDEPEPADSFTESKHSIQGVDSKLVSVSSSEIETTAVIEPTEIERAQSDEEDQHDDDSEDETPGDHFERYGFWHRTIRAISPTKRRHNNVTAPTSTDGLLTFEEAKHGDVDPPANKGFLSSARRARSPQKASTDVTNEPADIIDSDERAPITDSSHSVGVESKLLSVNSDEIETAAIEPIAVEHAQTDEEQDNDDPGQEPADHVKSSGFMLRALRAFSPPKLRNNAAQLTTHTSEVVDTARDGEAGILGQTLEESPEENNESEPAHEPKSPLAASRKFFRALGRAVSPGKRQTKESTVEEPLQAASSIEDAPSSGEKSPIFMIDSCESTSVRLVASRESESRNIIDLAPSASETHGETTTIGESESPSAFNPSVFDSYANSFSKYMMNAFQPVEAQCLPLVQTQLCTLSEDSEDGTVNYQTPTSKRTEEIAVDKVLLEMNSSMEGSSSGKLPEVASSELSPKSGEIKSESCAQPNDEHFSDPVDQAPALTEMAEKDLNLTSDETRQQTSKVDKRGVRSKLQKTIDIQAHSTEIEAQVPSPKGGFFSKRFKSAPRVPQSPDASIEQKVVINAMSTEVETKPASAKPKFFSLRFKGRDGGEKNKEASVTEAVEKVEERAITHPGKPTQPEASDRVISVPPYDDTCSGPLSLPDRSIKRKIDIHAEGTEIETGHTQVALVPRTPGLQTISDIAINAPAVKAETGILKRNNRVQRNVKIQAKSAEIEANIPSPRAGFFRRRGKSSSDKEQESKEEENTKQENKEQAVTTNAEKESFFGVNEMPCAGKLDVEVESPHSIAYPVKNRTYKKIEPMEKPIVDVESSANYVDGTEFAPSVDICAVSPNEDTKNLSVCAVNSTIEVADEHVAGEQDLEQEDGVSNSKADVAAPVDRFVEAEPLPAIGGLRAEPRKSGLFGLGKVFGRMKTQPPTIEISTTDNAPSNQIAVAANKLSTEPCQAKVSSLVSEAEIVDPCASDNALDDENAAALVLDTVESVRAADQDSTSVGSGPTRAILSSSPKVEITEAEHEKTIAAVNTNTPAMFRMFARQSLSPVRVRSRNVAQESSAVVGTAQAADVKEPKSIAVVESCGVEIPDKAKEQEADENKPIEQSKDSTIERHRQRGQKSKLNGTWGLPPQVSTESSAFPGNFSNPPSEKTSFDQSFGPKEADENVQSVPYVTIVPIPIEFDDQTTKEKATISHDSPDKATSYTAKAGKLVSDRKGRRGKSTQRSNPNPRQNSEGEPVSKEDGGQGNVPSDTHKDESDAASTDHRQVFVPAVSAENFRTSLTPVAKAAKKEPRQKAQRLAERRKKRIAKLVGDEDYSTAGVSEADTRNGPWWKRGPVQSVGSGECPSAASVGTKEFDKHMHVCAMSDEDVVTPTAESQQPKEKTLLPKPTNPAKQPPKEEKQASAKGKSYQRVGRNRVLSVGKPPSPANLPVLPKPQEKVSKPSHDVQQAPSSDKRTRREKLAKSKQVLHREEADDVVSATDDTFNDNLSDVFAPPPPGGGWLW